MSRLRDYPTLSHETAFPTADDGDRRLAAAARSYAQARYAELDRDLSRFELGWLLARLGFADQKLAVAIARGGIEDVPETLATSLRERLAASLAACRRQARRADPRYDINRHMALKRLMRWSKGELRTALAPSVVDEAMPGSGRELNGRFTRRAMRTAKNRRPEGRVH